MKIENIHKIVQALPEQLDATIHFEFNGSFLCPDEGHKKFVFGDLDVILKRLSAL